MDFEEFEVDIERVIEESSIKSSSCTVAQALQWVDTTWYAPTSRNARWMDLIGDYAGAEPFIIDGTSSFFLASFLIMIVVRALSATACS